ncbi:MAG: chemotaxis protein CheX [Deltaproteobacteria bacterium]|nr:chemotaxis protein CheX [Deltaproteobacteria bacterium]
MSNLEEVLDSLAIDACSELLKAYDVSMSLESSATASTVKAVSRGGVIGFSGEQIRGSLCLQLDEDVISRIGLPGHDRNDWIAELSNQLLGRIKNKLLKMQIVLGLGIPVAVAGEGLEMAFGSHKARTFKFVNDSGNEQMIVHLDCEFDGEITVNLEENTGEEPLEEGKSLIF